MRWSYTRVLTTGLIAAIAMVLAGFSFLSYSGFCFSQRRFLSDQDYFEATIERVIIRNSGQLRSYGPAGIEFRAVEAIKYGSADEFLGKNPNCCKVVPHNTGDNGPYTSFDQRLFGYAAKIISVSYLVNYIDRAGERKSEMTTEQFAVTNCGRAWN